MIALVLLALALLFGCAVVRAANAPVEEDLAWVAGPVIGLSAGFWVVYGAGRALGGRLGAAPLAVSCVVLGGASAALIIWSSATRRRWPAPPPAWFVRTVAVLAVFFVALNVFGILRPDGAGTVYSVGNAWADIPFHTSIVSSFAYRDNIPPTYSIALGAPLGYPYLIDFVSGALVAGGLSIRWAVVVVNVLVHVAFFAGFTVLVRTLTRSVRAAVASCFVLLFLGNLGILAVPGDIRAAHGVLRWLRALPWDYSGESLGTQGRARLGVGLYTGNPAMEFLLPRRSGAFGLAVGASVLAFVAELLRRPSYATAGLIGLLAGLTPRVHAHTAIALAIVVGVWALFEMTSGEHRVSWRHWAVVAAVAVVVALPQVLAMRNQAATFFTVGWLGWTGEPRDAFANAHSGADVVRALGVLLKFWVFNGGVLVLALPFALVSANSALRRFYTGFAVLWLFANVVKTQPWEWDNSSFFVWWQVGTVALTVPLVVRLIEDKRLLARATGVLCAAGLVAGGPISILRTTQDRLPLWSVAAAKFAEDVRDATPRDAAILTADGHAEPVNGLSGRQVYMGFGGWLGNHGLDATTYADRLQRMFSGDIGLMDDLGIRYVVLGPWERGYAEQHGLDLRAFADKSTFRVVLAETVDGQDWHLLRRAVP